MSLSRRLREAADEAASNPNIAGGARRGQAKTAREPSPPRTQAQIDAMVRRPRGGKDKEDEMDDEKEEQRDEQQKKKRGGEVLVVKQLCERAWTNLQPCNKMMRKRMNCL